jgi:hypothetical protein
MGKWTCRSLIRNKVLSGCDMMIEFLRYGCESRLLATGISVAIYVMPTCKVQEYWSNGVLGLKSEINLIFALLPLVIRDPNMVYIFSLYQTMHQSINLSLHYSRFDKPHSLIKRGCWRLPTAEIYPPQIFNLCPWPSCRKQAA